MAKKMKRVIVLATMAGPEFVYQAGEVVELEEATARAWVESGAARYEEASDQALVKGRHVRAFVVEEETLGPVETAAGARERGRTRVLSEHETVENRTVLGAGETPAEKKE